MAGVSVGRVWDPGQVEKCSWAGVEGPVPTKATPPDFTLPHMLEAQRYSEKASCWVPKGQRADFHQGYSDPPELRDQLAQDVPALQSSVPSGDPWASAPTARRGTVPS